MPLNIVIVHIFKCTYWYLRDKKILKINNQVNKNQILYVDGNNIIGLF